MGYSIKFNKLSTLIISVIIILLLATIIAITKNFNKHLSHQLLTHSRSHLLDINLSYSNFFYNDTEHLFDQNLHLQTALYQGIDAIYILDQNKTVLHSSSLKDIGSKFTTPMCDISNLKEYSHCTVFYYKTYFTKDEHSMQRYSVIEFKPDFISGSIFFYSRSNQLLTIILLLILIILSITIGNMGVVSPLRKLLSFIKHPTKDAPHFFIDDFNICAESVANTYIENQNQHHLLDQMFAQHNAVMMVLDYETERILDVNQSAIKFYQYTKDQLLQMTFHELSISKNKEFYEPLKTRVKRKYSNIIIKHKNAFHQEFDVEIDFATIVLNDNSKRFFAIIYDISEKIRMERDHFHNAKLQSIGELAAGVGHEINNPLTIAKGYLDKEKRFKTPEQMNNLLKIEDSLLRIQKITAGLRLFSHSDTYHYTTLNLTTIVQETIDLIAPIYRLNGINIEFKSGGADKMHILGNQSLIQQVLMNLFSNAKDALLNTEKKIIKTSIGSDQNFVYFKISDKGQGISQNDRDKIFDAFYSTKDINKGTGLGLSICRKIVNEHGGEIRLLEEKKTTFSVSFPLHIPIVHFEQMQNISTPNLSSLHILIVDDEPLLLDILEDNLAELGATIFRANNGEEALQIYNEQSIQLIISDVRMPKMDGFALLEKIKHDRDTPIFIFITGGTNVHFTPDSTPFFDKINGHLFKPYTEQELYEVLNQVLKINT